MFVYFHSERLTHIHTNIKYYYHLVKTDPEKFNSARIHSPPSVFKSVKHSISIFVNPINHSRTKNIEIRYHFIREHASNETTELHYVPTG